MPVYEPVYPPEVLSARLGLPEAQIIKLDANENPYTLVPAVKRAVENLASFSNYPDPESSTLRHALAEYHDIPADHFIAGAGADELIDLLIRVVLDPGDRILDCPPTFGMYRFDSNIQGAKVVTALRVDFRLDLDRICEMIEREHPKIMFVASPNNPDGGLLSANELEQLLKLPLILVIDEAYVDFSPPGSSFIKLVQQHKNLVVLRTFSKWAGLAGLRVGYGIFPSSIAEHVWKIKQPYNVSIAASAAAIASLENHSTLIERVAEMNSQRKKLFFEISKLRYLLPRESSANFLLCRVVERDAKNLKKQLEKEGILIRHFEKPGLTDYVRISIGTPEMNDQLMRILQRME
jgi:histidinol-phosphate aminotransferase